MGPIKPSMVSNITRVIHRELTTVTAQPTITTPPLATHKEKLEAYFQGLDLSSREDGEKVMNILQQSMETVYLRQIPLVSFDVEAYERSLSKITEIGISVYDPVVSDGTIFPMIKNSHLIIKEHQKLNNHRYCPDNKTRYLGGESHVVSSKNATKIISSIFEEYIVKRKGAFVGHHIQGDLKWLKSLKIPIPDDVPTVDTYKLYNCSRNRGGTLRGVLRLLDIPHGLLHNAGNDAYYTLLAGMAFCDPEVRVAKGLDTFKDVLKLDKSAQYKEKFTDTAALNTNEDIQKIIAQFIPQEQDIKDIEEIETIEEVIEITSDIDVEPVVKTVKRRKQADK